MNSLTIIKMTEREWNSDGVKRFGGDKNNWKFKCPACGHIASVKEWKDAGATDSQIAFSCIGRYMPNTNGMFLENKESPCNYAGGGLFKLNPVFVGDSENGIFEFSN